MNQFQQMFVMRAVLDGDWRTDGHDKRRAMTVEELDAIADFGWRGPDLKRVVAACVSVVQSLWRSRPIAQNDDLPVVSAETQRAA